MALEANTCVIGQQDQVDITVRNVSGDALAWFQILSSLTVMDLKRRIELQCSIPYAVQRVLIGDFMPPDSSILKDLHPLPLIVTVIQMSYNTAEAPSLRHAAWNRDVLEVERLLQVPVSPDAVDPRTGMTPLLLAVLTKSPRIVQLLCQARADVNKVNLNTGTGALHLAANDPNLVRILCDARANVNIKKVDGETPLLWAAEHGHLETVKLLLAAGACTESRRKSFCQTRNMDNIQSHTQKLTPLILALDRSHYRLACVLRCQGASPIPWLLGCFFFRRICRREPPLFPITLVALLATLLFHLLSIWIALAATGPLLVFFIEATLPRQARDGCCPGPWHFYYICNLRNIPLWTEGLVVDEADFYARCQLILFGASAFEAAMLVALAPPFVTFVILFPSLLALPISKNYSQFDFHQAVVRVVATVLLVVLLSAQLRLAMRFPETSFAAVVTLTSMPFYPKFCVPDQYQSSLYRIMIVLGPSVMFVVRLLFGIPVTSAVWLAALATRSLPYVTYELASLIFCSRLPWMSENNLQQLDTELEEGFNLLHSSR